MVELYPCARAHSEYEVSCQRVPNQLASSLCSCFVKASPTVEKASKRTDSCLIAFEAFSHRLQCTILYWRGRTLRTEKNALMPDIVAPKAHQNSHNYVSSADLPWWAVTRRTSKNHKTVKTGGWALAWDNMVRSSLTIYMYLCIQLQPHFLALQLQTCLKVTVKRLPN